MGMTACSVQMVHVWEYAPPQKFGCTRSYRVTSALVAKLDDIAFGTWWNAGCSKATSMSPD